MNEIGDLTRTESSYICCVVAIKLTVFGAMRIQHHLITCIMRTMFLQCDGKHSWDTFTTSITILKLRRNNSPRKLLALTLGNHHFLKKQSKHQGIMPECPHCAAHFMSWFPLKKHMYQEGTPCLDKEKKEQERIYLKQQLRKAAGVLYSSPPVTP